MATGWFQKATGVFSRREAPPQPYALTCDCGVQLSGVRAESPQRPSCPACGSVYFVLPACVYPIPTALRQDWFGEEIVAKKPAAKAAAPAAPLRAKERTKPAPAEKRPPSPSARERVQAAGRQLRSALTPLRLVALALLLVVGLTGLALLRGSRKEWARSHVEPAVDRGLNALRERDFPAASSAFGNAVRALDYLGRRDAAASAVRQFQREADIAAQLSSSSATELLARVSEGKKDSNLAKRFASNGAGEWMVFDAVVERHAAGGNDRCVVDVPFGLGDLPLEVEFDDVPWPSYWKTSAVSGPRRMVFAAQWDRLDLPDGRNRPARLVLRSSSAVLWCHFDSLQAITRASWEADQETSLREVLKEQRQALGVGEAR